MYTFFVLSIQDLEIYKNRKDSTIAVLEASVYIYEFLLIRLILINAL